MQTNDFVGSAWNKWDLHVHTPYSIINDYAFGKDNKWDKYILELEKLDNIKVLGINDYWFIDGYKKVIEYKRKGRLKNIDLILPIIELRLDYLVGNNDTNKINYHIIFSDELTSEEIEEEFIKKIEIKNLNNKSLTKDNLIEYGEKIINETSNDKKTSESPLQVGFNNFAVNLDKVKELLLKKLFQGKYLTAIGRTEWNDFRWDGSPDIKKSLINEVDLIFTASPDIEQFNTSKQKLLNNQVNDLLIHCSDAHQFTKDKNTKSKELGHCFTWIKAKPTFEGLKQIIYEPEIRLSISKDKPLDPIYFIQNITLNFEDNVKFKSNTFCFSGVKKTIYFSPNFTCIIGGRGSGKSTMLNLIAKKLNILENRDFFEDLGIDENKLLYRIKIEPDSLNNVEYLAQNTIEQFAIDTFAFSSAIFERVNKASKDNLKKLEDDIDDSLKLFDKHIERLKSRYDKHKKLMEFKKSLKNYENIVNTFNDEKYVSKKDKLQKLQKEYTELSNSIKRLHGFLEVIYEVSTKEPFDILESQIHTSRNDDDECIILEEKDLNIIKDPKNEFDELYNTTLKKIQKIYKEIFETEKYRNGSKKIQELKNESDILKNEIHNYLKEKGIKEESIQDIQTANENIEKLKIGIKELKREIFYLKKDINNFTYEKIDENIQIFKEKVQEQLNKSNKMLKDIAKENKDVKIIEIKLEVSNDIFEKVFNEFEQKLNLYEDIKSYRETFKSYLKEIELDEILKLKTNNDLIRLIAKKHKNTQTFQKIKTVFENKTNFLIFKTLILKHQRDIRNNKRFIVYYDDRDIKNSSFGQKCTTVIVIMLLLGNNPIIIDEPEAHLDSSLIANYLVNLIKEVKQDRQIIFATHNANFVLNGDAELIIKLENIDGITTFKSFAIEDIEFREDLLKLEGGKEAFKARECKYGI